MQYRQLAIVGLLFACASASPPRSHEIDCHDLEGVSFSFLEEYDAAIPPISPWHSIALEWLGEPTGITGRDLEALRVVEAPQRFFGLGEIGPRDPRFESTPKPLVPSLVLVFTA